MTHGRTAPRFPQRAGPVRFAVGAPDGLTSNSWRFWTTRAGDAYLACRDNFTATKVSLHASGRWRMGFTSEAITANPGLLAGGQARAWEVWDEPSADLPDTVTAFSLMFPTSELGVFSEQRTKRTWRETVFIEAAPAGSGKLTVVTLFITEGDSILQHESEPSFRLASLELSDGRRAQLVAHAELEGDIGNVIDAARVNGLALARRAGITVPDEAYCYFFGRHADGPRFIVGARAFPDPAP